MLVHVDRLGMERAFARVELGQAQQLIDEVAEAPYVLVDRHHELVVERRHAVRRVLEHHLQHGDRCPEFVGRIRDEVAALAIEVGEVGRHLVERGGELSDLVAAGGRDLPAVVAGGHGFGRSGHLAER